MINVLIDLETEFLGRKSIYYDIIDSTQSEIWRRVENNTVENGLAIIAGIQTNGKGTHGRIWHTDQDNNIAFSIYINTNNIEIIKLSGITIQIAEVLKKIFVEKYNIELEIKDPNDLMIKNKKIGGILTESKISSNKIKCIVIGIGINTNKVTFPNDIKNIATSINKEYGIFINNLEVISEFCNRFEKIINERISNKI